MIGTGWNAWSRGRRATLTCQTGRLESVLSFDLDVGSGVQTQAAGFTYEQLYLLSHLSGPAWALLTPSLLTAWLICVTALPFSDVALPLCNNVDLYVNFLTMIPRAWTPPGWTLTASNRLKILHSRLLTITLGLGVKVLKMDLSSFVEQWFSPSYAATL